MKHIINILTNKKVFIEDPHNANHTYNDKYLLSEFLTTITLGCSLNSLSAFINKDQLCLHHKYSNDIEESLNNVEQRKVNPTERVEQTTLIMASTLHDLPAHEILLKSQIDRVSTYSPMLFEGNSNGSNVHVDRIILIRNVSAITLSKLY